MAAADPTPESDPADDRRPDRQALQRVALRSRIRTLTDGDVEVDPAAVDTSVVGHIAGERAFYQTDDVRGLGPAVRWAAAGGATRLDLIADATVAGDLARRADHLATGPDRGATPAIVVWAGQGPDVTPAEPAPLPPPPPLAEAHRHLAAVVAESGARPVDDHGLLVAEVAGLEVARVVDAGVDGAQLAVGVGQADRELQDYLHGHLDDGTNLRRAIAAVVRHRHPGSAAHPLSRLSRQRWLRSVLLDDPGLVGLDDLEAVAPLRPRTTLLSQEPVAATGPGSVVVCSVGVDLDLLPEAADYRHREDPEADLIVVVPERDRRLVAGPPADAVARLRLVSIDVPWEATPAGGGRARR